MCLNSLVARVATQQAASTASIVWIEAALKYGSDKAQLDNAALDDRAERLRHMGARFEEAVGFTM